MHCQVDIESTVGTVCDAVLKEAGQPAAVLKKRAAALKTMGLIFKACPAGPRALKLYINSISTRVLQSLGFPKP